jgi:DNA-binding response OmpR family regulator
MGAPKTILIVDDSIELRVILKMRFEMEGYGVLEAENGRSGVATARREVPDLVVTDYAMPEMDGLKTAALLKQGSRTGAIPVLMLSSYPFTRSMIREMDRLRIDAFMPKPFDLSRLMQCIKYLLSPPSRRLCVSRVCDVPSMEPV